MHAHATLCLLKRGWNASKAPDEYQRFSRRRLCSSRWLHFGDLVVRGARRAGAVGGLHAVWCVHALRGALRGRLAFGVLDVRLPVKDALLDVLQGGGRNLWKEVCKSLVAWADAILQERQLALGHVHLAPHTARADGNAELALLVTLAIELLLHTPGPAPGKRARLRRVSDVRTVNKHVQRSLPVIVVPVIEVGAVDGDVVLKLVQEGGVDCHVCVQDGLNQALSEEPVVRFGQVLDEVVLLPSQKIECVPQMHVLVDAPVVVDLGLLRLAIDEEVIVHPWVPNVM
mmetsp:Transcript_5237/g.14636  ORF Transcript_5237/g.14636 Transcript_5237/m.14636 type:complete len:286 (-) Transcript_5237:1380-2237(-)